MRFSDLLEWAAGACLTVACLLWLGAPLALLAAALFLLYQAECHADHTPVKATVAWGRKRIRILAERRRARRAEKTNK